MSFLDIVNIISVSLSANYLLYLIDMVSPVLSNLYLIDNSNTKVKGYEYFMILIYLGQFYNFSLALSYYFSKTNLSLVLICFYKTSIKQFKYLTFYPAWMVKNIY